MYGSNKRQLLKIVDLDQRKLVNWRCGQKQMEQSLGKVNYRAVIL